MAMERDDVTNETGLRTASAYSYWYELLDLPLVVQLSLLPGFSQHQRGGEAGGWLGKDDRETNDRESLL